MTLLQLTAARLQHRKQRSELFRLLQLTQLRRVRRTDIHGNVIRDFINQFETREIVAVSFSKWRYLALADADSEHAIRSMMLDSPRKSCGALVIEPGAINECLILRKTKKSGPRISLLWMVCNSACFNETKTQSSERL